MTKKIIRYLVRHGQICQRKGACDPCKRFYKWLDKKEKK